MDQETPTLTIQDSKKSPKKLKIPSTIKKPTKTKKFSKKTIFREADLAILEFWLSYLSRQSSLLNSHKI